MHSVSLMERLDPRGSSMILDDPRFVVLIQTSARKVKSLSSEIKICVSFALTRRRQQVLLNNAPPLFLSNAFFCELALDWRDGAPE